MAIQVISDSVASIPADLIERWNIKIASLHVHEGDVDHVETELDVAAFNERLTLMPEIPTSSQPSVEQFVDLFSEAAREGRDVVGVFISEKMSGTLQSARLASSMIAEEFPAWRYSLVDAKTNSMQEGLVAIQAAKRAAEGATLEQVERAALDAVARTKFIFSPESLEYLRKGGRIGGASALLANMLQIRPILTVADGQVETLDKVRTVKRALSTMAQHFSDDVARCGLEEVLVHYIGSSVPAQRWATEVIEPIVDHEVRVLPVSPVIGVHVGPAVGLVYRTASPL